MRFLKPVVALSILLVLAFLSAPLAAQVHPSVRIKDLADVEGVRSNQLVGLGVVTGLQGTGDKGAMATQMLRNLMSQFGVTVDDRAVKSKNAAVVNITADLPAFARPGQRIDVTVSAMGDAKSLQGGSLIQTPLKAADGGIYAVAQGPVMVGGFTAGGQGATATKNIVTVGRIPGGAIVERGVESDYSIGRQISLLLRNPDFTTSDRMARAVNEAFGAIAYAEDGGRVTVNIPPSYAHSPAGFIARLEGITIRPDSTARVVVNERTGTVVMGGDVRISAVAVAHGSLTVQVAESPLVSQPQPFSGGSTTTVPRTDVGVQENSAQLIALDATSTVKQLVDALNSVGASPRDIIAILQAVKEAGALHGELVVM